METFYYTSKDGVKVEVSREHIETAIRLKKELQKASPSFVCSWKMHKNLMMQEGFDDSENSERYRLFIKNHQSSSGQLESRELYESKVAESTLKSIKNAVGELTYAKQEVRIENQKLNKLKRELIDKTIFTNSIIESLDKINIKKPNINKVIHTEKGREILVLPSDWHVGYLDDEHNYEKSLKKIENYVSKVSEYANIFDVNTFHVVHLGDIAENLYMHKNSQSFNAEFTFAEQIVKSIESLYFLIESLALIGRVVFHGVVRGNHGRMSAKGETVSKDCAEYIVHEGIKTIINKSNNPNIIVDEIGYDVERSIFKIKDKVIKAIHGDTDGQNDKSIIQKHISFENNIIDILCIGHFHNYKLTTENFGRLVYQSGCLQGATDFSKSLKYNSSPSQGLIVIGDNEVIPININL